MNIRIPVGIALISTAALLPLLHGQTKESNSSVEATIKKLEDESVKADLAQDKSWTTNNTTTDYISGSSLGEWEDKAALLKDMADPANNKMNKETLADMKVTSYGDTAIARYSVTYDSVRHGKPLSRTVICTDTWAKQGDSWKEVASHCSQKGQE